MLDYLNTDNAKPSIPVHLRPVSRSLYMMCVLKMVMMMMTVKITMHSIEDSGGNL